MVQKLSKYEEPLKRYVGRKFPLGYVSSNRFQLRTTMITGKILPDLGDTTINYGQELRTPVS